jgi:two-component system, OmpR family, sensor kinase
VSNGSLHTPVSIPGGIRVRIALALAGIVALALGAAYLIVIPSLEQRLVNARLDQIQKIARPAAIHFPRDHVNWQQRVELLSTQTNARVVAFDVLAETPPALVVYADSRSHLRARNIERNPIALRCLVSGHVERGRIRTSGVDLGDVAEPLPWGGQAPILLFQTNLTDSLATVRLVQRRFLLATGFALVLAFVLGLIAAGTLALRLRRLEKAAERIAGGDFAVPVVDRGDDEIGQLAGAFDRMRVQLAQLDDARKEFVANASHELRTPLFSLGGFLELLTDEELDDATRRGFLATMQSQVERLTRLSADLLDLSRVDAGQLRLARDPVDLGELARDLAAEFEPVAAGSGHAIETELEEDVWCLGDEERVFQVGRALLANAMVHTPAGTRIVLRVRRNATRVELAVEDEGPGIAPAQQSAVFARFYRVEGGMASGSGLGLAIAKELARLMDGSVRLESRPGRTVFTLDLPADDAPDRARSVVGSFSRENDASTIST